MNQKTKKFPVSLGHKGFPTKESEFLIPPFSKTKTNTFIGIESGKENRFGAVSFIGMEVDANEVLSKLKIKPENLQEALHLMDDYLTQLQNFKIGNIISITYEENGHFTLNKEAERIKNCKTNLP